MGYLQHGKTLEPPATLVSAVAVWQHAGAKYCTAVLHGVGLEGRASRRFKVAYQGAAAGPVRATWAPVKHASGHGTMPRRLALRILDAAAAGRRALGGGGERPWRRSVALRRGRTSGGSTAT